jgi:rRNA maturation endonuclease Nob1
VPLGRSSARREGTAVHHHGLFYGDGEGGLARDANRQANAAKADARRARTELEELGRRVERLSLMTEALWTLLRTRLKLTDEELVELARQIDLSDGHLDGRVRRASAECSGCGRMVAKKHVKCLYCGTPMQRTPFSDV